MASIRKNPRTGHWEVRYRDVAGVQRTQTPEGVLKSDAQALKAAIETDMARGQWRDPALARVRFSDWADEYFAGAFHKRPSTLARDKIVYRTHLAPQLGPLPMAAITPLHVRRVVDGMRAKLAPATVRTNYAVLKAIMNAAVEADIIAVSPCRGTKLVPESRRDRRVLAPGDLARLAAAMPSDQAPIVYLAGVLGLRWSEIAGLRVKRLDFLRRTLEVAETVTEVEGTQIIGEPKTRAGRRVLSVPPLVMDMLAEHLARRGRPAPDEWVFVTARGNLLRATNFRNRVWNPAVAAAGLDGLTFHGLRHAATSLMVGLGEHPRVVQHRLGHATARLSMELYAHVPEDADRAAAAHLEALFTGAGGADVVQRGSGDSKH